MVPVSPCVSGTAKSREYPNRPNRGSGPGSVPVRRAPLRAATSPTRPRSAQVGPRRAAARRRRDERESRRVAHRPRHRHGASPISSNACGSVKPMSVIVRGARRGSRRRRDSCSCGRRAPRTRSEAATMLGRVASAAVRGDLGDEAFGEEAGSGARSGTRSPAAERPSRPPGRAGAPSTGPRIPSAIALQLTIARASGTGSLPRSPAARAGPSRWRLTPSRCKQVTSRTASVSATELHDSDDRTGLRA